MADSGRRVERECGYVIIRVAVAAVGATHHSLLTSKPISRPVGKGLMPLF